ncbi:MAG: hypothetical protein RLY14_2477 [Planctomycetota bacterium]|jgi:DNA-binding NtrC family response regulator
MNQSTENKSAVNEKGKAVLRILAVDDERDALENLREVLEHFGYVVHVASSGAEAIQLAEQNRYDVALLDFRMPGMNGLELASKLKLLLPGIVTILITAFLDVEQQGQVVPVGQLRKVISKPLNINELSTLLQDIAVEPSVLVVDDDLDLCHNMKEVFEQAGFSVHLAHHMSEAEKLIENLECTAAIIDFRIPGGDGIALARRMQEKYPGRNIILMTGFRDEVAGLVDPVIAEVCFKPFDIRRLIDSARGYPGDHFKAVDIP